MGYIILGLFATSILLGGYCGFILGGLVGYFLFSTDVVLVLFGLIYLAYTVGQRQIMEKIKKQSKQTVPNYDKWHDMREEP